ncbi:MAG: lytic transglycosylase domain-containing protein [Verrucomicrobia bacterium]|nr:MAG: lytic transglycosylase domain-containing protein [Verrucomicrobiota bacterium]
MAARLEQGILGMRIHGGLRTRFLVRRTATRLKRRDGAMPPRATTRCSRRCGGAFPLAVPAAPGGNEVVLGSRHFFLLLAIGIPAARCQDLPALDDLFDQGRQLVEEHLDDRVGKLLEALESGDRGQTRRMLEELQRDFMGDQVLDLPRLKRAAQTLLPILEEDESTLPFAAWLRSRMDYFEVAEDLGRLPPPPVARTNTAGTVTVQTGTNAPVPGAAVRANPPAAAQREAWERRTAGRAAPAGAARYVERLKPVFAAFGVPEELVWLAEVESSFDPAAESPVGALGLFQLMPTTAHGLGLSMSPRDERRHPEKSARAAAAYLKSLHDRFHDWRLALAAYNAGEGRVHRLMEKHHARTFDELSPYLPAETQMYVPKIEALVRRREGKRLQDLREG